MEYIILLVSLVGIVFSADYLVAGSVSIARKFKVSDFVWRGNQQDSLQKEYP